MKHHYRLFALLIACAAILRLGSNTLAEGLRPAVAGNFVGRFVSSGQGQIFFPLVAKQASFDPVILAAGDTRSGCEPGNFATVAILDRYRSTIPILHNGDFTNSGAASEFADCYSQTWGTHKAQTRPVPGNHEYLTADAAGYFDYFGTLARPQGTSYYSFDVGSWHIVALNSEIDASTGSAQVQWLEADLASHPAQCTLAYWHKPRFSSGEHGNSTFVSVLWQTLYDHHAEIVLNGHDHDYERFARQNSSGELDEAHGIQEFVIGTGGVAERPFATIRANSAVRNDNTWGILELTLHRTSYEFRFVPVSGGSFSDVGSMMCH